MRTRRPTTPESLTKSLAQLLDEPSLQATNIVHHTEVPILTLFHLHHSALLRLSAAMPCSTIFDCARLLTSDAGSAVNCWLSVGGRTRFERASILPHSSFLFPSCLTVFSSSKGARRFYHQVDASSLVFAMPVQSSLPATKRCRSDGVQSVYEKLPSYFASGLFHSSRNLVLFLVSSFLFLAFLSVLLQSPLMTLNQA
jgi:hypothetical protein